MKIYNYRRITKIIIGLIIGFFVLSLSIKISKIVRWGKYIKKVKDIEGVIVTDHGQSGRDFYIEGLVENTSADPILYLSDFGIDSLEVRSNWRKIIPADPGINLEKLLEMLNPPDKIIIELKKGEVIIKGPDRSKWIKKAVPVIKRLTGIKDVRHIIKNPA